jgi:folate-binding protein YgfZ
LIRMQVDIRPDDSRGFLRLAGPKAPQILRSIGASQIPRGDAVVRFRPRQGSDETGEILTIEAPYPRGGMPGRDRRVVGYDLMVEEASALDLWQLLLEKGGVACGWRCLEAFRILAGHPTLGAELDEKTIVQETRLESAAVSFEKGCYLGQELVARIASRGHVNRYLRRIRIIEDRPTSREPGGFVPPRQGSELLSDDKLVGTVTSSAVIPGVGTICLAYLRREIGPGERVDVISDGGRLEAVVEEIDVLA